MKTTGVALFLIVSFMAVAMFGFSGTHTAFGHENGCLAATVLTVDCPKQGGLFANFSFHMDAFNDFASAAVSFVVLSLLFILALVVPRLTVAAPLHALRLVSLHHTNAYDGRERQRRWLALHENSPTIF